MVYFICFPSLKVCYPTISVVYCLGTIVSCILPNVIVVFGRRVTTARYSIMARSTIPFNSSVNLFLQLYNKKIKSKEERMKLKLLALMHLKRNNYCSVKHSSITSFYSLTEEHIIHGKSPDFLSLTCST